MLTAERKDDGYSYIYIYICPKIDFETVDSQLFALGLCLKNVKKYTKGNISFLAQTTPRKIEKTI